MLPTDVRSRAIFSSCDRGCRASRQGSKCAQGGSALRVRVLPLRQWYLQLVGRGTPPAVPLTLACSSARPPASVSASSIFFCMACTRARGPLVQPHVAVVCIAVLRRVSTVTRHTAAVAAMAVVGFVRDAHALLLLQLLRCRNPPKLLHDNVRWGTGSAFKNML